MSECEHEWTTNDGTTEVLCGQCGVGPDDVMETGIDAQTVLRNRQWQAADLLKDHQILGEAYWDEGRGARWYIGRPRTFVQSMEIIAGVGGSLVVHGDWQPCRFAHYGDWSDAFSRLLWLADCTDVGYYVMQKAAIGGETTKEYEREVAVHDINAERAELYRNIADGDTSAVPLARLLSEAVEYYSESEQELRGFLSEHDDGWDLWEREYGHVVPHHVIFAHAALNRTAWLLRERYGRDGPPICAERRRRDSEERSRA